MIHLRICLIGHYNVKHPDEGVRNIAFHIAEELSKTHEILKLDIKDTINNRRCIKRFNPEIIHYILSPTAIGLITAKFISVLYPHAKSIISAPHPDNFPKGRWISLFRPDIVLVQSCQSEKMFQSMGYRTKFLPNGVDVEKFVLVSEDVKERLREKYNIDKDNFIILHVGSIKSGRNLHVLKRMQKVDDNQVLVIGSTSTGIEKETYQNLKENGCVVWTNYFKNIEEIYALSDCYVFPTTDKFSCIETPMSILEAMACNLPVVSTKFGALPRIFEEGDGLMFVEKEEDFFEAIEKIKNSDREIKTREKVLPFSWYRVVKMLEVIYDELL